MSTPSLPVAVVTSALLFDMDGTLVDSTAVVERTWRRFARRHGVRAEEILAVSHGRRTEETVARFAPADVDAAAEARRVIAEEVEDTRGITAIPGAAELLASLPESGWALVTSAGRRLAEARMRAAGLPLPPVLVSADDVAQGKPNPEGYLQAARRLGRSPESLVVFEDAEAGILAARASGARTVVVGPSRCEAAEGLDHVTDLRDVRVDIDTSTGRLRVSLRAD
ncbi:HAD family hydrolase [Streptomyces sp. SCSIO ZS0520]|uniref:HAD family hydrolase n=1 Tax=Streptomyces sp. SCSIO ZS0520 TaxID=2892996 RepID=UPI0021D8B589|nr:HAD family hydrolase [Streptomyces sp. SCSIO ZS0520]